jgi:magnesium transporter
MSDEMPSNSHQPRHHALSLQDQETSRISEQVEEMPPADGADVIEQLPAGQAAEVAGYLDPSTAGRILAEMASQDAAHVIEGMPAPEASMVLAAMDADDRVDVLEHLDPTLHDQLLHEFTPADVSEVLQLEQYPPDTAGGIMNPQVTALRDALTVEQAIAQLRQLRSELGDIFYVYIVDAQHRLIGVLSMRDLIFSSPQTRLRSILRPKVTTVPATMDQEKVAELFRKYNYLALPVVDAHRRLLGIVTVDDVVDVISDEANEDIQRMAGASAQERLNSPWTFSFRKRIVWLEVNLATAFLAGSIVALFEGTIAKMAILAVYMPIVAGMGGNASAQAMSVAIRGIALDEVNRALLMRVLMRELLVGLVSGIVIGLTTAIVAWTFHYHHGAMLGVAVAIAIVVNMVCACLAGVGIPFVMKSLHFDPAQSATIFITTVTDVVGFFAFLGLAYLLIPGLH